MTKIIIGFDKKLKECGETKGLSRSEVANSLNTNHSIVGKYERDEVKPTVDVVKRLADVLETTVGFPIGKSEEMNVLKDPGMLKRLNDLVSLPQKDREGILYALMVCSEMQKQGSSINKIKR